MTDTPRKISELAVLSAVAADDYLPIVDVSEPALIDKNKRVAIAQLLRSVPAGSAAAPGIAIDGDPNTGIYSPGADQLAISTGGTERLRVDGSGRLLVGTTSSPGTLLTVQGDGTFRVDTGNVGVGLQTGSLTGSWYLNHADNSLRWYSSTGGDRFTISSAGNAGIGTTAPNRKLEVSDATADNFIRVNTTGATKSGIEFASGGTVYSQLYFNNVSPYDLLLLQQHTTGSLILGTNNIERMRIKSNGTINFSNVATYADNAAATSGGLVAGDVYRTSTGQLMIRY
jgi:hypothetical protein